MSVCIVTGSSGLIGSETVRFFHGQGFDVIGLDNDMRAYFFGAEASVGWNTQQLQRTLPRFRHHAVDIRDASAVEAIVARHAGDISLVVHTAGTHNASVSLPGLAHGDALAMREDIRAHVKRETL